MSARIPRIDVHHHFFPESLDKAKSYKEVGWRTPEGNLPWTPEVSLKAMDRSGIDMAILSLPALSTGCVGEENRLMARDRNVYLSELCAKYPRRFGFFATLPFPNDADAALAEIKYALDELKADGIAISSSYGVGSDALYIGHDRYDAIWQELDARQAVVLLHGVQVPSSTPFPHPCLGIPISEVPNETFKAAAHLVVTGRKRKYPNVKIILAHMGGSTAFLAARVAPLAPHMGCPLSPEEILEDFKSFYCDTALAAYETNLAAIDTFLTQPDRMLFGTDFPAVSTEMAGWYTKNLEEYYANDPVKMKAVLHGNALKLFPRLQTLFVTKV